LDGLPRPRGFREGQCRRSGSVALHRHRTGDSIIAGLQFGALCLQRGDRGALGAGDVALRVDLIAAQSGQPVSDAGQDRIAAEPVCEGAGELVLGEATGRDCIVRTKVSGLSVMNHMYHPFFLVAWRRAAVGTV